MLSASDGAEALALARRADPDLIVTDLMLPGMDGRQLWEQLRTDLCTAHIPVLLLTADVTANPGDMFADVIIKPFDLDNVLVRIRRLIG